MGQWKLPQPFKSNKNTGILLSELFQLYTNTNPLTLLTGIEGHALAKRVPRANPNEGIDCPLNIVWIYSVQCR